MKDKMKIKLEKRMRRHKRVRSKIFGTAERPRLSVFRSHKHIYAQLINDEKGVTIVAASDHELKQKSKKKKEPSNQKAEKKQPENLRTRKVEIAYQVGELLAKKALEKNIKKVVFDRGGYKYHGRIKALAEGARAKGLHF